ncbi:hypothetical protein [Vibrio viridaestus]|uniref:Uncharacterized protein n=1 Tax=Vibrio viridaestus TaxID=2487322 RepID=A0A3N9TA73_9VIBR|nr:hypothetical protein [Vibrio viridaestus]RQW61037.1 hypothetical protein EES38_21550 [Vibrio viridaestus]
MVLQAPKFNVPNVDMNKIALYLGVGMLAYLGVRSLLDSANQVAAEATKGAGEALSYLTASLNGWEPIEFAPLMIRDFYLNSDYTLTVDARDTLWKIDQYKPLLIELFGNRYAPMKQQYRSLINVEITKEML